MESLIGNGILLVVIVILIIRAYVSNHQETLAEVYARGYHQGVEDTIREYHINPNIQ